jgi:hypothetical protein
MPSSLEVKANQIVQNLYKRAEDLELVLGLKTEVTIRPNNCSSIGNLRSKRLKGP